MQQPHNPHSHTKHQDAIARAVAEDPSLLAQYPELQATADKAQAVEEKERGNAAFTAGKHDVAIEHYSTAIRLDPTYVRDMQPMGDGLFLTCVVVGCCAAAYVVQNPTSTPAMHHCYTHAHTKLLCTHHSLRTTRTSYTFVPCVVYHPTTNTVVSSTTNTAMKSTLATVQLRIKQPSGTQRHYRMHGQQYD